ncbi:hypothetical protein [Lentilactobacillus kosonis]|uniref:DNA mismatch repair protein MutS n=1 Tax=Lentilactobacillus kosonis TaxID=2810561 RepID=A0A401FNB3_9LACO|nr:DNA mismatch repair protein MutS [Lentilactobacillus kosonis]
MEDPKLAKGMVKREVIQLVTPGTQFQTGSQNAKDNNYLTALTYDIDEQHYGFAYADLSTGELKVTNLSSIDEIINEVVSLSSKETVVLSDNLPTEVTETLTKLGVLISHQEILPTNAATSYLSQDVEGEVVKQVVTLLLSYIETTQNGA